MAWAPSRSSGRGRAARRGRPGRRACAAPRRPAGRAGRAAPRLACSRSSTPRATPSEPASRLPRNDLREAPTSTGKPRRLIGPSPRSSAQLCSAVLAKPRPGSSTIRSRSMPAARIASTRSASSSRTAATTPPGPSYDACCCMVSLCARQCMATYAAPVAATVSSMRGSASPPETSLTMSAPASRAASATSLRIVSTDTVAPSAASAVMTGTTRASSSSTSGRVAPGRVDSPPTSRMSAPATSSSRPCAIAASGVAQRPPSENESGVTLTTPISTGRSVRVSRPGRPAGISGRC